MRGRLEEKAAWIAGAAGEISEKLADEADTDISSMDPWHPANIVAIIADSLLTQDVENTMDLLVQLQVSIADTMLGLTIDPEGGR